MLPCSRPGSRRIAGWQRSARRTGQTLPRTHGGDAHRGRLAPPQQPLWLLWGSRREKRFTSSFWLCVCHAPNLGLRGQRGGVYMYSPAQRRRSRGFPHRKRQALSPGV
eukprot:7259784-Prymnesium_polylepis.1